MGCTHGLSVSNVGNLVIKEKCQPGIAVYTCKPVLLLGECAAISSLTEIVSGTCFGIITEDDQFVNSIQIPFEAFPTSMYSFMVFTGGCLRASPSLAHPP